MENFEILLSDFYLKSKVKQLQTLWVFYDWLIQHLKVVVYVIIVFVLDNQRYMWVPD